MNKFLTAEEFDRLLSICDDEGTENGFIFKYFDIVKR